jgi:hypothetical protein
VTEDLRALLRADLDAERPPPLGDLVGAAIREGRRRRRHRRIGLAVALATAAMAVLAVVLVGDAGAAGIPARERMQPAADGTTVSQLPEAAQLPPETVPITPTVPTASSWPRTLTTHSGTESAGGMQKKATSAAMLHLLTLLLPPGRTSHFGVASDNDLLVQLYLDAGDGPGMLRVTVDQRSVAPAIPARGGSAEVTVTHSDGDCAQNTSVSATWPDGTFVELDMASCAAREHPALTTEQAVRVVTDPRWGVTMDADLVATGTRRFPAVPVFAR